jgi:hypothetical protein
MSRLDKHHKNITQTLKNKCANVIEVFSKGVECFRSTRSPMALPVSQYYCKAAGIFYSYYFQISLPDRHCDDVIHKLLFLHFK